MKSELIRELSKLEDFQNPKISLEQYMTPPELAADILHTAYMNGDIEGKEVADLGTGTGILAIGSALLGADTVAIDKDSGAIDTARQNVEKMDVSDFIDFKEQDVMELDGNFDTVVMNPPFSVHSESDISFLRKAVEISSAVYAVSHPGLRSNVKDFIRKSGYKLVTLQQYSIALPPTYGFHTEESRETDIDVLVTKKADE